MTSASTWSRPTANAEQIRWQRRAVSLLSHLLELAARQDLPAIAWDVSSAGACLTGECLVRPHSDRRAQLDAWRLAIGEPTSYRETSLGSGDVRLVAVWDARGRNGGSPLLADGDGWQLAQVVIRATILTDDEPGETA